MASNQAFTLDQLAHFDRCLFPATLFEGLKEHGVRLWQADAVVNRMQRQRAMGGRCGVIDLYQEFIGDIEVTAALEAMVLAFVTSNKPS